MMQINFLDIFVHESSQIDVQDDPRDRKEQIDTFCELQTNKFKL